MDSATGSPKASEPQKAATIEIQDWEAVNNDMGPEWEAVKLKLRIFKPWGSNSRTQVRRRSKKGGKPYKRQDPSTQENKTA